MKSNPKLFCSVFLLLLMNFTLLAQVPETEKEALIALYNSTGGENWFNNTNWNTTEPVIEWYGISVDTVGEDHVNSIQLSFNNLDGSIPEDILDLSALKTLEIRNNNLTGEVLNQLIQLTELVEIDLAFNDFDGQIPFGISGLTDLSIFTLSGNSFSGQIPAELGDLTNLNTLYLANNTFSGSLPDELGQLTNLVEFWISGNDFAGPIPTFFNDLSLDIFNIYNNHFDELPFLGDLLDNIEISNIYGNNFEFDDLELNEGHLVQVDYNPMNSIDAPDFINVSLGEDLNYTIDVGGANNTYQWYKDGEALDGQIENQLTISNISDADTGYYVLEVSNTLITDLILSSNEIHIRYQSFENGVSTEEYNALLAIYNATDGDNWTTNTNWNSEEPVGNWFGVTVEDNHVSTLLLNYNNLNGSLPIEIGDLTYLTSLKITNNELLIGEIPEEIGNLTGLTQLNFSGNALSGAIPDGIGNSQAIWFLRMGANEFEDSIPASIWELNELTYLDLSSNNLVGNIPSEISNLSNLTNLNLSFNQLSGTIPNEIGVLSELIMLRLTSNAIGGLLPIELGDLSNLTELGLGNNDFTGEIPSSLGNLDQLQYLNTSANQLSGSIPTAIWNLENLINLNFAWNQLDGNISSSIEGLGSLEQLWLNNNQFSGTIPEGLGSLVSLTFLYLDNNEFEGTLPNEITNLVNLSTIGLSNNLFDSLPDLSVINNLESMWIQENKYEFDDIEPHIGITNFNYTPQANVDGLPPVTVAEGAELSFSLEVGGSANSYQWFKNGAPVDGQTSNTFYIETAAANDAGTYVLQITNSIAEELTLTSEDIVVDILTGIDENTKEANFALFPNPSNGAINIDLNGYYAHIVVKIYSPDGRLLQSISKENNEFLSFIIQQNTGMYIVEVMADNESRTFKLLIN